MADEKGDSFMAGFMFGNIDQSGCLEDDGVLDEEFKKHLGEFSIRLQNELGVKDLLEDESQAAEPADSQDSGYMTQDSNAVDYSDINELIEDEEGVEAWPNAASQAMAPPPVPDHDTFSLPHSMDQSKRLVTPLADMLPPEFKGKDVREYFPDFRVGEVLRFSRLFPPQYPISLYKRKKKTEEGDKPSKPSFQEVEFNRGGTPPAELIMKDDQITFLEPLKEKKKSSRLKSSLAKDSSSGKEGGSVSWRYGPAQYWYDLYGVDPNATTYDYGLKKKADKDKSNLGSDGEGSPKEVPVAPIVTCPDDAYLMVCQKNWEDDIIWSGEESRADVSEAQKTKGAMSGWLPTAQNRTVESWSKFTDTPNVFEPSAKRFQSFFPIENTELVYAAWEKEIIWDPENMDEIPEPRGLTLDLNDDNIVYEIPEDKEPVEAEKEINQQPNTKKEPRKSQLALQKIGIVKEKEEEDDDDKNSNQRKDPFNISNDEYYNPKIATDNALRTNVGGNLIQHSTPAVDLKQPFFPTFLGITKLRQFHRPPLKKYSYGAMYEGGPIPVNSLLKTIKRKAKLRDQERQAMGGGEIFFMRTPADLSACDGELILAEYSEEFPPVMMQSGMATKIKNYYKRKPGGDNNPATFKYGELAYAHHSPFLGNLNPGQTVQAFENNMFRAPIYQHLMPETDFLVIRTRQNYYIRKVTDIFCVGQLCPLSEVPGPNSKRANVFIRDFLQAFIYRLFWASNDVPRRIKMEDIKRAFQSHSESSIRKRLKLCADFKRTGMDSNWWVVKPDFRLPSHEEIRAMVSPEQCCQYYSLVSAEQRLKDAGYGEKSLFAPEQDEDDEAKIEDEVKTAPWNTTRAYIQAVRGKCLLSLTGDTDPTGCGEGFAYVRVPNKPIINKADQKGDTPQKKTVTGTAADLRRLSLADAKKILRDKGFPEAEIKKLSRWEVIDCVRTMSTHEAKAGEEGDMTRFARGNRQSVAEHQERYKEECQRLFDLQNKILGSEEVLSTDEEGSDSGSEDLDYDEMGKNIENILTNKKSSSQLSKEKEEAELKQLHKTLMDPKGKDSKLNESASSQDLNSEGKAIVRKLKITRTFENENGDKYTRSEIVTKPLVIEAYLKIKKTRSKEFIVSFASMDEVQKEEMKRERRRLQEQLRRIKRNEEKLNQAISTSPTLAASMLAKKKKKENAKDIKLKCGACGQVGHMRTNKECPQWATRMGGVLNTSGNASGGTLPSVNVALTVEEEEDAEKEVINTDENLVQIEGTKVVLSKQLVEHADKLKKQTLTLKFPKKLPRKEKDSKGHGKLKRKASNAPHCDYLTRPNKVAHRRRADPLVSLCSIFEGIISELKEIPDSHLFHLPVSSREVIDYYRIITKPMDLQTLKTNVRNRKYESRAAFLEDVHLIYTNSQTYNGEKNVLTFTARKMLDLTLHRFAEKEDKLMRLEKAINPLLDDDDLVAFSYVLENIVENHLHSMPNVRAFLTPVNKKQIKDYYNVIAHPMDLQTLMENVKKHKYHTGEEFLADVELIYTNCLQYNGEKSELTKTAFEVYKTAQACIEENAEQLREYEEGIKAKQEAAMDGLESESIMTGTSFHDDLSNVDETGDYTIVEGGNAPKPYNPEGMATTTEVEEGEYVDIMDSSNLVEEEVPLDQTAYYMQGAEGIEASTLGLDLQLSGEEDEFEGSGQRYRPELPLPDEDSQMSFNADEFFQTNFQMGGHTSEGMQGDEVAPQTDIINDDLQLSESDDAEDYDQPSEGVGFDFDEFED
ncbi:transcription initiation factor TFIID subunit 1-like [Watersipora subatra]|uniref:transcription initiation factor TFIID subunit 1-like n=1 Tax=Watersipora subatra TaxID=2589382 RepID=UPI00355BDE95